MQPGITSVVAVLVPVVASAQPRISPGGVIHAAGLAPAGLPGSSIARGSLVSIMGSNLGPAAVVQAHGDILEQELAGVSVTVIDSAGVPHAAYPVFVQSGQINALMPCPMALGTTRLTVTVNGRASPPSEPFQTVQRNFQLFTRNHKGWGPAVAENIPEDGPLLNSLGAPAAPGGLVALWGTGLGACGESLSSDHALEHRVRTEGDVEVLIGNKRASVAGYRREAGRAGVERILVLVPPDAPEGCYVPVVVRSGHNYSNSTSLSIGSQGGGCRDTLNGFTLLVEKLQERPVSWARIQLFRGSMVSERPGIGNLRTSSEIGEAVFLRSSMRSLDDGFHYPAPGTCLVMPRGRGNAVSNQAGLTLEAGELTLRGPWELTFFRDPGDGIYRRRLSPTPFEGRSGDFIRPGATYAVAGHGSQQVGHFEASLTVPGFLEWTNREHLPFVLHRSAPIVLTWSGGDSSREFVAIRGVAIERQSKLGRDFICTAPVQARTFTLPEAVIASLPASESDLVLSLSNLPQLWAPHFHASGIEAGFFVFEVASGRNFELR